MNSNTVVPQQTVQVDGGSVSGPTQQPQVTAVELSNLGTIVQEWRRIHEEISELKQQAREKSKRIKVLEEIVLKTMSKNNIGALDLKNSGGRILYNKKQSKEGLNVKVIQDLLAAHLKSPEKAQEAVKYINENRKSKTREALSYEKDD